MICPNSSPRALLDEATLGRRRTLVAKLLHSSEIWNPSGLNQSCKATERESEHPDPRRINMDALAPFFEHKSDDLF